MTAERPALVLHDVGAEEGGAPWRAALCDAGWPGPVTAPDLPGHVGAPPPTGGNYETTDAVLVALGQDGVARRDGHGDGDGDPRPVVVGIGVNGWSAQLLALGGRASGLVLVDGLHGPWLDHDARLAAAKRWLRAMADTVADDRTGPDGRGLDPRLRHPFPTHGSRSLAERAAAAMAVPALLVESASSPLPPADRDDLAGRFAGGVEVASVEEASPPVVAEAATAWAAAVLDAG